MSFGSYTHRFLTTAAISLAILSLGCIGKDTTDDGQDLAKCRESGNICTVAGTGVSGYNGTDKPALDTYLSQPNALVIDTAGRVLINDSVNYLIRRIGGGGDLNDVAGDRTKQANSATLSGLALASGLNQISDMDVGPDGKIYLIESGRPGVLALDLSGPEPHIELVVGSLMEFDVVPEAAWPPVVADINELSGIAVAADGSIYATDLDKAYIWRFELPTEAWDTDAADFAEARREAVLEGLDVFYGVDTDGFSTEWFGEPRRMAIYAGGLYVADSLRHAIARVELDGSGADWVVGAWYMNGWDCGLDGLCSFHGEEWPGADEGEDNGVFDDFEYNTDGHVPGNGGDGELMIFGISAPDHPEPTSINTPHGVSFTPEGRMLIADSANNLIRVELSDGTIDTVVGLAPAGYTGDEGPAISAGLSFPTDVIMGGDGQVFIADSINAAVRWIANPTF
jgi:sugar lactone lactonase YvrE